MSFINKILKPLKVEVHRTKSLNNEKAYYGNTIKRLSDFYMDFHSNSGTDLNRDISCVVFSKDRAMQLHALLSSYFHYTRNPAPLIILFTFSNEGHKEAYKILQREFESFPVTFVIETDFTVQLKEMLHNIKSDRIFFMTDDAVFLDHYDLHDCLNFNPLKNIFSLHHGTDLDYCFSYHKKQAIPGFSTINKGGKIFNSWIWEDMVDSPEWIYPLSVDAIVFSTKEIEMILQHISFKSPNSLESQMQLYINLFIRRKGICYTKVKYVNVPCNLVQTEFNNNSTGMFSTDELLEKFLHGQRIDWQKLQKLKAPEAQTVKFTFT